MPLAQCRECGKEVSTEAVLCPHCGVPRPTVSSPSAPLGGAAPGSSFRKPPPFPQTPKQRTTPPPEQIRPEQSSSLAPTGRRSTPLGMYGLLGTASLLLIGVFWYGMVSSPAGKSTATPPAATTTQAASLPTPPTPNLAPPAPSTAKTWTLWEKTFKDHRFTYYAVEQNIESRATCELLLGKERAKQISYARTFGGDWSNPDQVLLHYPENQITIYMWGCHDSTWTPPTA